MNRITGKRLARVAIAIALTAGAGTALTQDAPTPQERVAMLKQWLQASQQALHHYQWVETTVVTHDGEVASHEEKNCYYDVTGTLVKVPVAESQQKKGPMPGILPPGRLIDKFGEHRAKEMKEYMQSAAELVHSYVPPTPSLIQQSMGSGKMSLEVLEPGREVQLDFRDYLQAGDMLGVQIGLENNQLLGLVVDTYVGDPSDPVTLNVTMGLLPDGTMYAEKSVLDAPNKKVEVTVTNSGYREAE
jgi:hypothetical protein